MAAPPTAQPAPRDGRASTQPIFAPALLSASRRNVELKNELQKLREEFANERREYLRLKKDTFRTKRGRLALLFGPRQRSAQAQATPALTLDERIPKLSVNTDDR